MNNDLEQFSEERLKELADGNKQAWQYEIEMLSRIALAAKQAKPVAYMYRDNLHSDARFSLTSQIGNWSSEEISEYEIAEIPLYTTPQPAHTEQLIPDGWKLVPIQPTEEMINAWGADMSQSYARVHAEQIGEDEVVFAYQAMIASAPKPESE